MSNGLNRPSARAQAKSLSERVSGLEQNFARFLFGINQRLVATDQRLVTNEELIDAVIELQGRDEVMRLVDERRLARAKALAEQEKATLDRGIIDGYVSAAEKVGARSIIVGKYLDSAGNVIEPGRTQLAIPGIEPEFRQLLLGNPVGTTIDLPDGQFVLQEIYEVDEKKALELQAKSAAAAVAEAGETASGDEQAATDGSN